MGNNKPYFEGWYFKHQKEGRSFAVIPGIRRDDSQGWSAFIQIVTTKQSYYIPYPAKEFRIRRSPLQIRIGDNIFTEKGIRLSICNEQLTLRGTIHYRELSPVSGDIMGPFAYIPGMECSHSIISMSHSLYGSVILNGETLCLDKGRGYIESDRGGSFPSSYFWTQCGDQGLQIMAAAAVIPAPVPMVPLSASFDGCICLIRYEGKEYRLATYLGARIERWTEQVLIIRQRSLRLEIRGRRERGRTLKAPNRGRMDQEIEERLETDARYRLTRGRHLIFDMESSVASMESVYTF